MQRAADSRPRFARDAHFVRSLAADAPPVFWLGRNWARWLVLVASVVALANLAFLGFLGSGEKLIAVGEGALAIWLLVWLNTRSVRAFFSGRADTGAV
jgi:hypothetical protein